MHVTMLLKEAGSSARVAESPFSLSDGRREKKADNNTSASTFDADIAPIARPANKLQHHMRDLDVFFLPREMAVPRQLRRALGRRAGAEMKTRRTAEWHIQDTTLSAPHYPRRRTPPPPLARLPPVLAARAVPRLRTHAHFGEPRRPQSSSALTTHSLLQRHASALSALLWRRVLLYDRRDLQNQTRPAVSRRRLSRSTGSAQESFDRRPPSLGPPS